MNIYDISKLSGVSIATVSRVINGKGNVSEQTRARVLAIIEESGYTPNAFARGLGSNTVKTVGLLCLDVSDIYLAGAVSILERELRAKGYNSLLCCTGARLEDKAGSVRMLLSKMVDAIILIGSHFVSGGDYSYITEAAGKVPVIIINGAFKGDNIYCALTNDFESIRQAAGLLIKHGHRKLLYIYDSRTYSGLKKLSGYKKALEDAGISFDKRLMLLCERDMDKARKRVCDLLDSGIKFTAALSSEDELAAAVQKAVVSRGIDVPREIEIIGYNNSIISKCCSPELTSIDSRVEELCTAAITLLFSVFEGERFIEEIVLPGILIPRGSTR